MRQSNGGIAAGSVKLVAVLAVLAAGSIGFVNCSGFEPQALSNSSNGSQVDPNQPPSNNGSTSDSNVPREPSSDNLPRGLGWHRLPNTKLSSVCPPRPTSFAFPGSCEAVVYAWSGGIADTQRQRMILWGGGHNDYYGNEVYALDLRQQKMVRLTEPTFLESQPECSTIQLHDGRPNGRHTYNGLAYIAHLNQMFVVGGGPSCGPGGVSSDTWLLDLAKVSTDAVSGEPWQLKGNPVEGGPRGGLIAASDYDPVTKLVYLIDSSNGFYSYDPSTNAYRLLLQANVDGYWYTAVIDPKRRLFIAMGNNRVRAYSLNGTPTVMNWDTKLVGCDSLKAASYPGLAYDSRKSQIVGWAGGSTAYVFDPETLKCTPMTFETDAPGPQQLTGTHGRFRYFPEFNAFVLVNGANEDAYLLRLTE